MSKIEIEDVAGARWVWLNRPEVHNAQDVQMLRELDEAFAEASRAKDVSALVIGGRGPSFSSGHDLRMMHDDPEYSAKSSTVEGRYWQELELYSDPIYRLLDLPMPTIARVQGNCIAGGAMLAAAADFVVCDESARFAAPVLKDLAVNDAEVPTLVWRVGVRHAKELIWTGRSIDGARAVEMGLANWVVNSAKLDEVIRELIAELSAVPAHALALSKSSLNFLEARGGRDEYFKHHYVSHQLTHHTDEARAKLRGRIQRIESGRSPVVGEEDGR